MFASTNQTVTGFEDIRRLSLCPLKWLCFVTFAAFGAIGYLSDTPGGSVIYYENV
jgi:hypothetical protein